MADINMLKIKIFTLRFHLLLLQEIEEEEEEEKVRNLNILLTDNLVLSLDNDLILEDHLSLILRRLLVHRRLMEVGDNRVRMRLKRLLIVRMELVGFNQSIDIQSIKRRKFLKVQDMVDILKLYLNKSKLS